MPRASHGIADHDAVGQRSVVVRAMGADGEERVAALHEQRVFSIDFAGHHPPFAQIIDRNSTAEIGNR